MSMPQTKTTGIDGERGLISITPTILTPIFNPWPWPLPTLPIVTERSQIGSEPPCTGDILEVLEAVYPRPDVRGIVAAHARIFTELLGEDEEAAKELRDLVQEITPGQGEREPISLTTIAIVCLCCAVAGGVVGYLSRG